MKNSKKNIYILLSVLLISILFFVGAFFLFQIQSTNALSDSEMDTSSEETTETDIEVITKNIIVEPQSYVEECELSFVETPVKRTREEAVAKIKDLSKWFPALYYVYENADQYPLEILLTAAGNPELTDFAYGYLTSDGSVTGGFTDEEQPEDYPLFLQFDSRWAYMPYGTGGTVGSSGCGPTCLSMAIFYLTGDRECTPDAIAQYSLDNGYYVEGVGTAWSLLSDYPAQYGLSSYQINWTQQNLKDQLDKGNILICSVRKGDFTSAGHFIVIYGYDENGFKINDPKCVYRSRQSWTYQQIRDDIKATWSVGY